MSGITVFSVYIIMDTQCCFGMNPFIQIVAVRLSPHNLTTT